MPHRIEEQRVFKTKTHIASQIQRCRVHIILELMAHCAEVHGIVDNGVVGGNIERHHVHGLEEHPRKRMAS
jgi:hypothetical protein